MLLELHCHTSRHSPCSYLEPVAAARAAVRKGLQGLVITEHEYLWTDEELDELRREAELDEAFLLFSAQEVDTDIGHVLAFGADRTIAGRIRLEELRRAFPGAALVWAHPFRHEREPSRERLLDPRLDAVEIFNSNHSAKGNYCALTAWHEHKFVAVGGSDAHDEQVVGMCPTQLDHPVGTIEELTEEILRGRCRPFFKEIPHAGSNITVTEIVIGTKGEDEVRQRIVVKQVREQKKWRRQQRSLDTIGALHNGGFSGGTFRVPKVVQVIEDKRLLIEEGQRGRSLFDLLRRVDPDVATTYFELAAGWLATMHGLKLRTGGLEDTVRRERRRYRSYRRSFVKTGNPYREQAERLLELIENVEGRIFERDVDRFVQNHGDFHPKNIIIGQDRAQDISTIFVSVIDFDNTLSFLPAFDVGYFLAQFGYQLREHPGVIERFNRERFLDAYRSLAGDSDDGDRRTFPDEVSFFEVRGIVSIASYLIKVGKGESEEMQALIARAMALAGRLEALA